MRKQDKLLAALDSSRRRLNAEVEGLQEPRFSTRPPGGGWSVAQVVEHLSRADESLARGIPVVVAGRAIQPRWTDPLSRLLYLSQIYKIARVKSRQALDPADAPPRPEAMARSAATRAALLAAIDAHEGKGVWKARVRHPIFGPLSMTEMIAFIADHEERHRLQIVRIKAALERETK